MMANEPLPCSHPGCLGLARWKPIIKVAMPDNDRTFELQFPWFMCDTHKDSLTLDDMIGDKNIAEIQCMFINKTIHPPKKEHMTLRWESLYIPIFSSDELIGQTIVRKKSCK